MTMSEQAAERLDRQAVRNDRILRLTRWVAIGVIPFLVAAFIILAFFPNRTGEFFAWPITPPMTALLMGAGYLGGAYFFARVATESRWRRVAIGFPAVTVFTVAMLAATLLHMDRFNVGTLPFYTWLALYIVTPVLIPVLWLRNRNPAAAEPEAGDVRVPGAVRVVLALVSLVQLGFAVVGFARPDILASVWPWEFTPLTGRVLSGWLAFLGVGGLVMARETLWSAWRIGVQSITLWQALVLVGALAHPADFTGGLLNWYTLVVAVGVLVLIVLYVTLENRRRALKA